MVWIEHVIEFVELFPEEFKAFLHYPTLNRISKTVHVFQPLFHQNYLCLDFVFLEEISVIHRFDRRVGGLHERKFIPTLVDVFVEGIAGFGFDSSFNFASI